MAYDDTPVSSEISLPKLPESSSDRLDRYVDCVSFEYCGANEGGPTPFGIHSLRFLLKGSNGVVSLSEAK